MLDLLLVPLMSLGPVQDAGEPTAAPDRSVKELRQALRKETEAKVRGELLDLLAKRAASEPEAAEDAWESIADSLEDESFVVRREAIRLLKVAPQRELVVKPLTDALSKSMLEAVKAGGGSEGRGSGRGGSNPLEGFFGDKKKDEEKKPKKESKEEIAERAKRAAEEAESAARRAYFKEVIDAVAELPDDRSVKALARYLDQTQGRGLGELQVASARALARLGTKGALESVRKILEKTAERAAAEKKILERGAGGGGRNDGPTAQQIAMSLHAALKEAAERSQLTEIPEHDEDVARSWKKFLSKNSKALPAKLGKIEAEKDG